MRLGGIIVSVSARLRRDRRSATAVLFALLLIPLLGVLGAAIDAALYFQARAAINAAANSAVMQALKIASAGELNNDGNYLTEGRTAGTQWFTVMLGNTAATLTNVAPSLTLAGGATVTASLTATAKMSPVFGRLFGFNAYAVQVAVAASVKTEAYLQVVLLLDNSSSMEIGAGNTDIAKLSSLSACDPSHAFYLNAAQTNWSNASNTPYNVYGCSYLGGVYDGVTPCPVATPSGLSYSTFPASPGGSSFPSTDCKGLLAKVNGFYPGPGPPCAFACHWTSTPDAGGSYADLFGMARRNGITLRFDIVKSSAIALLKQMQTNNLGFSNLSIGIYTFETGIAQIYPTACVAQSYGCEAGSDFATAQTLVGAPPTYPSVTDTGITPPLALTSGDNNDTAFPYAMNTLASSYVTSAGDGSSALSPKKVLFIITDGYEDNPFPSAYASNFFTSRKAFESAYCTQFKTMGYSVYVAHTPYYPLMHTTYLDPGYGMISAVEGSGTDSIAYQLAACSSGAADYVAVTAQATLTAALLGFLKQALTGTQTYTK